MTMPPSKYEFNAAFQTKIAALVVRDNIFNRRVQGLIKPECFDDTAEATLVSIALAYFARYKKCATLGVVIKQVKEGVADKSIAAGLPIKEAIKRLKAEDISDRDYVVDEVAKFAQHQAIGRAIFESVDLLEEKKFDAIAEAMKKAVETGSVIEADVYDFFKEIKTRTTERLDTASGKLRPTGITTGWHMLDEVLYHKGWGRQELTVLMGVAKMGKTMALADFALKATIAGHNVLYVTLEVSRRILADRMDANLSITAMSEIIRHTKTIEGKIGTIAGKAGALRLEEFPSGSMQSSDLRRLIGRYKADGLEFDLIVVDYADIMAPENILSEERHNLKSIYVDLRAIAWELTAPGGMFPAVLTATQTNRDGARKTVATMTEVAEDFNKIRIADLVLSLNASEEERLMQEARIYFAASRNQADGFSIRVKQDRESMRFITKVMGKE